MKQDRVGVLRRAFSAAVVLRAAILYVAFSIAQNGAADPASIVKHINTAENAARGCEPENFKSDGQFGYFTFGEWGYSNLYQTDGTPAGTRYLANDMFEPTNFKRFGANTYFSDVGRFMSVSSSAHEMSRVPLDDYCKGLAVWNNRMYIRGGNPYEFNVYVFDDVNLTATLIAHLPHPNSYAYEPEILLPTQHCLLLCTMTGVYGSDGTSEGTHLLGNLNASGAGDSAQLHDSVFFAARQSTGPKELWKSDGTDAGTTLVATVQNAYGFTATSDFVYFSVQTSGYPNYQYDLWRTAGTAETTTQCEELLGLPPQFNPGTLLYSNHKLYVSRRIGMSYETWRVPDDAISAEKLLAIDEAQAGTTSLIASTNDRLLLASYGDSRSDLLAQDYPNTLWAYTIDSGSLVAVQKFSPMHSYCQLPLGLALGGFDTANGFEPWFTDGTEAGSHLLADLAPGTLTGSLPTALTPDGKGGLYFQASSETHFFAGHPRNDRLAVWHTDGTAAGTSEIRQLSRNVLTPEGPFQPLNEQWLFAGDTPTSGIELWKTDGTPEGTTLVKDIGSNCSSEPANFVTLGNKAYFAATRAIDFDCFFNFCWQTVHREMWSSDGTAEGTNLFAGYTPTPGTVHPFVSKLVFGTGYGTYVTDGTESGTELLIDGSDDQVVVNGGRIFFVRNAGELTISDGTASGTQLIRSFPVDYYTGWVTGLTSGGGFVYFIAPGVSSDSIRRLYRTDGTAEGTVPVPNLGDLKQAPANLLAAGNRVFFTAKDEAHGTELWVTNGSGAGTHLVREIYPGSWSDGTAPENLTALPDGRIVFTATDGFHGRELWISDGTAAGTRMVQNINRDGDSDPGDITVSGNRIYFFATTDPADGVAEREIWSMKINFELPSGLPDLYPASMQVQTRCTGAGCKLNVNLNVVNGGESRSKGCIVSFYLSNDTLLDANDILVRRRRVGSLGALKLHQVHSTVHLNQTLSAMHLLAVVDGANKIEESDETNNVASWPTGE